MSSDWDAWTSESSPNSYSIWVIEPGATPSKSGGGIPSPEIPNNLHSRNGGWDIDTLGNIQDGVSMVCHRYTVGQKFWHHTHSASVLWNPWYLRYLQVIGIKTLLWDYKLHTTVHDILTTQWPQHLLLNQILLASSWNFLSWPQKHPQKNEIMEAPRFNN